MFPHARYPYNRQSSRILRWLFYLLVDGDAFEFEFDGGARSGEVRRVDFCESRLLEEKVGVGELERDLFRDWDGSNLLDEVLVL